MLKEILTTDRQAKTTLVGRSLDVFALVVVVVLLHIGHLVLQCAKTVTN